MKLLKSERLELPKVYFITDRNEIEDIPPGVPFIYGDERVESYLVRMLEYEVLYQEALKTGYPFNFAQILKDYGFVDIKTFNWTRPTYMELSTEDVDWLHNEHDNIDLEDKPLTEISQQSDRFKEFVKDASVYVDIEKLKKLNVFPVWLNDIEEAVETNVHNFAVYNPNMYNKKLEGMYGAIDLISPPRNLIVIDISGSIPRAVSTTTLMLAKNLAETFFCDLLITGSKSTIYPYEELYSLNVQKVYDDNGMDNDQLYFKKLVTTTERKYRTAIIFGDNHNPGQVWHNQFNQGAKRISRVDGKKICKWKVEKVISFHTEKNYFGDTSETRPIAGYGEWFTPKSVKHIDDWVKYLN